MAYDASIPGWMSPPDFAALESIVAEAGGDEVACIVEVGAWCGRSAACWAMSSKAAVFCVDDGFWRPSAAHLRDWSGEGYEPGSDPRVFFKERVMPRFPGRMLLIEQKSLDTDPAQFGAIDIVFIDALHQAPYVAQDIAHWAPHVRPGGIVAGDDAIGRYPAVLEAASDFARARGAPLHLTGDKIWWVRV